MNNRIVEVRRQDDKVQSAGRPALMGKNENVKVRTGIKAGEFDFSANGNNWGNQQGGQGNNQNSGNTWGRRRRRWC